MAKSIIERINNFADVCALNNKQEQDFVIPENATALQRFLIRTQRCWLIAIAYNEAAKVDIADIDQTKYTPTFWIEPDEEAPSGFRLSLHVCVYGHSTTDLGARPPFLNPNHAMDAGGKFLSEFTAWNQDIAQAFSELAQK